MTTQPTNPKGVSLTSLMKCVINDEDFVRSGQLKLYWEPEDPLICKMTIILFHASLLNSEEETWICSYEMIAETAYNKDPGIPVGEGDIQFAVSEDTTQFMIRLSGTNEEGNEHVMCTQLPCFMIDSFCSRVAAVWEKENAEESYLHVAIGDIERWVNEQAKPKE